MIPSSVFAGLILFWPAVLTLFFLGFCCVVFAIFLIGSTVLVFSIFLYGLYCILRDLGLLDVVFQKIGKASNYISEHVKTNVEESFIVESLLTKPLDKPALFLCHPHGLYGLTWFIHFAVSLSKWPLEQRPILAVHSVFFKLPIFKELFRSHQCIEAKESEIGKALKEGRSVALLVGGVEELQLTAPGPLQLILKKRSGYARISQEYQVPLVPVICPGENNLFPASQNPLWKWIQTLLYKNWRIALPSPSIASLWSWISIAYKPFQAPLLTYVLDPVHPDQKSIEDIKSEYQRALEQFSKAYSIPMEIVN